MTFPAFHSNEKATAESAREQPFGLKRFGALSIYQLNRYVHPHHESVKDSEVTN